MTIVISFFQDGNPILVGDLLLSGNEPSVSAQLPTTGSVENVFPQGSGFVPIGLAQKIVIISDKFAVAWAGRWIEAKAVIADIRDAALCWSWEPDAVESSIISIIKSNSANDLSLIWLIFDGKQVIQNGYNTFLRRSEKPGYGRILGIGNDSAVSDFDGLMDVVASSAPAGSPGHPALPRALVTAAAFSMRELLDPNMLINYFGGGYEILLLAENRFQKLDDYVFVVWDAEEDTGGYKIGAPYYFQRHLYHGDILLIRAAKFESAGKNDTKYSPTTFLVHPATRFIGEREANTIPNIGLNSPFVCNIVRLRNRAGNVEIRIVANRWVSEPALMTITEEDGNIDVVFRSDYLAKLIGKRT